MKFDSLLRGGHKSGTSNVVTFRRGGYVLLRGRTERQADISAPHDFVESIITQRNESVDRVIAVLYSVVLATESQLRNGSG